MHNLLLEEGDMVQIESISLPVATFSKFQPQSPDFLDITNPKAVLENALRNFACLTTGDLIAIKYNSKVYELCVLESKPGNAVSIIECDMNVEFAAPVGYQEPQRQVKSKEPDEDEPMVHQYESMNFVAFSGEGTRLDGKKKKCDKIDTNNVAHVKKAHNFCLFFFLIDFNMIFYLFSHTSVEYPTMIIHMV